MNRLAALEIILLACWLGAAILVAAVLAPAAFRVLPTRTMAGALVGEVLPVIFIAGLVVAILAVLIEIRINGHAFRALVAAPFAAMIIGCSAAQFIVAPKIESARASIAGPVDALDAKDPRRIQFGKLHALSVMWMGVAMLGAGAAIGRKIYVLSS